MPTNGEGGELEEDGDRSTSAIVRLSIIIVATCSVDASIVIAVFVVDDVVAIVVLEESSEDGSEVIVGLFVVFVAFAVFVFVDVVAIGITVGGNNVVAGTCTGAREGGSRVVLVVAVGMSSSSISATQIFSVKTMLSLLVCPDLVSVSVSVSMGIVGAGSSRLSPNSLLVELMSPR